jgi:hypothetical protein
MNRVQQRIQNEDTRKLNEPAGVFPCGCAEDVTACFEGTHRTPSDLGLGGSHRKSLREEATSPQWSIRNTAVTGLL